MPKYKNTDEIVKDCSPVVQQYFELLRQRDNLSNLLREILMMIRTNRLRGTLTSADEQDFDRIIESWKAKWDEAVK